MFPKIITVNESTNLRLDHYLAQQKIAPSRSQISRWIREGHVLVNGGPAKPSTLLKTGDSLEIQPPEAKKATLEPEDIPLDILFEDEDLLVLNKPADLVVHPGAGHPSGTLTHALIHHCGSLSRIGGVERPGIVHRLDKGTSGAMVVAKNDRAHLNLSKQFTDRRVKKIYWAVAYGVPLKKEGSIQGFIARSPENRKKFSVHPKKGKHALTHYSVLASHEGLSLWEIQLETGRTHQIRVHLTEAGHGLVGDPVYGGHKKRAKSLSDARKGLALKTERPLLHARIIGFFHPSTGEWAEYEAALPSDFAEALKLFFPDFLHL